ESDKNLFETYGQTLVLKRNHKDEDDQDEDPTAGSNRGLKRRKTSKGIENSKKTSTSKDSSKDSDDDAEFDNVDIPMDHGEYLGNTKEQVNEDVVTKQDWHKKSNADSSLDPE
nr:hypothetical protein [Tanacetum cinerariifolium]